MSLDVARAYSSSVVPLWAEPTETDVPDKDGQSFMYVVITSDKGLCGSVNSQLIREVRPKIKERAATNKINIIPLGDKGKGGLERLYGKFFSNTFSEMARVKKPTFKQVCEVAQVVAAQEFDKGELYYNKFKSVVSFVPSNVKLYPASTMLEKSDIGNKFEHEADDEIFRSLWEYRLAVRLNHCFAEAYASELASRMNAMGGSSKSAGEILTALKLKYNRTRQAKITSELIEIISGAAAAEEQK